jgi:putative membrane protein insertion efficiency factor
MRIRTWQPTRELAVPPAVPAAAPCCVPCCCVVALVSPLLLVAAPVRVVCAAARSRARSQPHIATVKHATGPQPDGRAARLLCRGIRFYQAELSPLTPPCPQTPSCSQYAAEALQRHGAARGSLLTARRLLRCRPGAGGFDPVP